MCSGVFETDEPGASRTGEPTALLAMNREPPEQANLRVSI
jgi:hypothetical protein